MSKARTQDTPQVGESVVGKSVLRARQKKPQGNGSLASQHHGMGRAWDEHGRSSVQACAAWQTLWLTGGKEAHREINGNGWWSRVDGSCVWLWSSEKVRKQVPVGEPLPTATLSPYQPPLGVGLLITTGKRQSR
jgi:hypothetical protein